MIDFSHRHTGTTRSNDGVRASSASFGSAVFKDTRLKTRSEEFNSEDNSFEAKDSILGLSPDRMRTALAILLQDHAHARVETKSSDIFPSVMFWRFLQRCVLIFTLMEGV